MSVPANIATMLMAVGFACGAGSKSQGQQALALASEEMERIAFTMQHFNVNWAEVAGELQAMFGQHNNLVALMQARATGYATKGSMETATATAEQAERFQQFYLTWLPACMI